MSIKYKDSEGNFKEIKIKTKDSLPVGTIVDYDGHTVPEGYVEVEESKTILFESLNGSADTSITLLDTPSNYEYIEIYYSDLQGNDQQYTKLMTNHLNRISLPILTAGGTKVFFRANSYQLNGNVLNLINSYYFAFNGSQFDEWDTNYLTKIFKIIGIKEG